MSDDIAPVNHYGHSYRLYWIYGPANHLLYVGITSRQLHRRLKEHSRTKAWWPAVVAVYCRDLRTTNQREAERFERDVIRELRPARNLTHNTAGR